MQELQACRRTTDLAGGGDAGFRTSSPADGAATAAEAPCGLAVLPFREVWAVDFEYNAKPGTNPEPVCLVAWELRSDRKVLLWRDGFSVAPPYSTVADVLSVAYYASAEIGCHLALDWPVPERVLDLFTEFRNHTNGIPPIGGAGLLGALAHYGLDSIGTVEKEEMRDLVLRGGPWSDVERAAIHDYCESDVAALSRLLPAMLPKIDLPRALLRGRFRHPRMITDHHASIARSEVLSRARHILSISLNLNGRRRP